MPDDTPDSATEQTMARLASNPRTRSQPRQQSQSQQRSRPHAQHLTNPGGSRKGFREQDQCLAELLTEWTQSAWPDDEAKHAYMESEVEARLASYRTAARAWRGAQISIWLLIALLGLLISVFAGFKTGHGFTIVAGALVATLTTLTNASHPSKQADGYLNARLALRDQGWDLLNQTGTYAKLNNDQAYATFTQAVHKIVITKRSQTSLDSLAS
ncbi:MAG: hypothetical protein ACTHQQ_07215 [Solirubrobacteraceae bacterium]